MNQALIALIIWLLVRGLVLLKFPAEKNLFIFEILAIGIALGVSSMWSAFFMDKDMIDADEEDRTVAEDIKSIVEEEDVPVFAQEKTGFDEKLAQQKLIQSKSQYVRSGLEAMNATADEEFPQNLKDELGKLIDYVVRDYVSSWYSLISDDHEFESDVRMHLATVLTQIGERCMNRLNLVAFALDTIADATTLQLRAHGEARAAAAHENKLLFTEEKKDISLQGAKQRNHATLNQLAAKSRLHPAISWDNQSEDDPALSASEKRYLRHTSAKLLRLVAPAHDLHCRALRHLLREILANVILGIVILLVSEPSNLATWFKLLQQQEKGQDRVTKIIEQEAEPVLQHNSPTGSVKPGQALPGFKQTRAWHYFYGAVDAQEIVALTADAKEGSFVLRAAPDAESRAPNEPVDLILSYVAQPGAVCSVVFFAEPALVDGEDEVFQYMRFIGGARDPRLLDRANQFAAATSLETLLETQFQDVAFRGIDCRADADDVKQNFQQEIIEPQEDDMRKRTPMPHESDDATRLFAEQVRHVLLIELQAAVEMAEEFANNVMRSVSQAQQNKPNSIASSLKRGLGEAYLSKEGLAKAQARRDALAAQEAAQIQVHAWGTHDGINASHRLLTALDACLAHTGQDDSGQAAYAAYFQRQEKKNTQDLDEEQQHASGLAWLFQILESSQLHAVVYDACADTKLTANYYGTDAILREPSDLARFLWFAERIDAFTIKPNIPALVAYDPDTYTLAASIASSSTHQSVDGAVAAQNAQNKNDSGGEGIYSVSIMSLTKAAISSTKAQASLEPPDNCKSRKERKKKRQGELVTKGRAAAGRALSMQSSQESTKDEACRVNYLLKRRPLRSTLIEYGLLVSKQIPSSAISVKVVVADDQRSLQTADKSTLFDTLVTTLSGSSGGSTVGTTPKKKQNKTTYYQIWLLTGGADAEKKPIVVPISRRRACARRRYRDFRALRSALASNTRRQLPKLPPRRIAERLYARGKPALEARRVGLETFLLGLLSDKVLRHSHELRAFLFDSTSEMRVVLRASFHESADGTEHFSDDNFDVESDDDDDDDDEDDDSEADSEEFDDEVEHQLVQVSSPVTAEKKRITSIAQEAPSTPRNQEIKIEDCTTPQVSTMTNTASPAAKKESTAQADWRRLKRVEHRTYMLLRGPFDVDHMGLMRRNFVALLRRGARALWSPAMATWLGSKTARDARLRLLTHPTAKLNELVWPNGQPRLGRDQAQNDIDQQDKQAALIALRQDLASAIPASLASLVGQSAADDAVSKLHDLLLCPTQLRSLAYTILDLYS